MRSALVAATLLLPALAASLGGCERPPVGPPGGDDPIADGRVGPLALELFTQDRPVIGGKWYDYDADNGHALSPKPEAWIVREPSTASPGALRHAAFRIVSVYETDVAESGRFTLGIALHDGDAWGAESEWTAPRNVNDGPVCVDLFSAAGTSGGVDCSDDGWQVRLTVQNRFSNLAGIAVNEPAVYFRSVAGTDAFGQVLAARLDDTVTLTALPDPATLPVLDDEASADWASTDWSFGAFAADLPRAGMAVGDRFVDDGFVGRGDTMWLIGARFDLVRFTAAPVIDGDMGAGLRISWSVVDADREDWSAPEVLPAPTTVDVPMPASDGARYLSFASPSLDVAAEHLEGTSFPFAPPATTRWDLALVRAGDSARLLVSPASCVLNASQLAFDVELPPVSPSSPSP